MNKSVQNSLESMKIFDSNLAMELLNDPNSSLDNFAFSDAQGKIEFDGIIDIIANISKPGSKSLSILEILESIIAIIRRVRNSVKSGGSSSSGVPMTVAIHAMGLILPKDKRANYISTVQDDISTGKLSFNDKFTSPTNLKWFGKKVASFVGKSDNKYARALSVLIDIFI